MPRRDAPGMRECLARRLLLPLPPIPAMVWLITALWASLLVGASLLWPMSYGADEPAHIGMAYAYSANPFHFYGPGRLLPAQAIVNMEQQVPGYPPETSLAVASIPSRGQRPTFAEMGGHTATHGTTPDQMVQHPPLYYWSEAVVLRLPGVSHLPWDKQVWLMRLLSAFFMLPIPILCWASAKRALSHIHVQPDAGNLAVLAALIPLSMPNLIRIGASVTNESLLILATSIVLYLGTRVITGDLSRRTSAWMGAGLAVALLTKGSAFVLPPIIFVAYMLGARFEAGERPILRSAWPALVAPAVGCAIGSVWWLRNLLDYGEIKIDGFGSVYERTIFGPPHNDGGILTFIPRFLDFFISRIWGGIGLRDEPSLGPFLVYGWFALIMIGVVTSVFMRTGKGSQLRTFALLAAPVLTMVLLLADSYTKFHRWPSVPIDPRGSQGHYVYHLIVIISALAVVGWSRLLLPQVRRWLVPITLVGAILTNAVAWLVILSNWYEPRGAPALRGYVDAVHGLLRWSPAPKPITALVVGVLPVLLGLGAIIAAFRSARTAPTAKPDCTDLDVATPNPAGPVSASERANG